MHSDMGGGGGGGVTGFTSRYCFVSFTTGTNSGEVLYAVDLVHAVFLCGTPGFHPPKIKQ